MRISALLTFIVFACGCLQAQNLPKIPAFGSFTDVDWETLPIELDSVAQFWLFKSREIQVDVGRRVSQIRSVERQRLMVRDAEYESFPLLQIPLYTRDSIETLRGFRVKVVNPNGSFSDFDREDVQFAEINDRYVLVQFIVENVTDSSIIDIEYQINRKYVEEIPAYVLADRIPILHQRLKLQNSPFLVYKTIPQNMGPLALQHFTQQRDTSETPSLFYVNMSSTLKEETYWVNGIPGWPNEDLSPEFREYAPQIKFLWTEFGSPRQPLEQSWPVIAAEAQKRFKYNSLLEDRIQSFKNNDEQLSLDSVSSMIRKQLIFDGQKGIIPNHFGIDTVDFASQADINMELVARAIANGNKANIALVSSAISTEGPPQLPNLMEFSSLIARVDGQYYDGIRSDLAVDEYRDMWALNLFGNDYQWQKIELNNQPRLNVQISASIDKKDVISADLISDSNNPTFLDWLAPEISAFPNEEGSEGSFGIDLTKSTQSFDDAIDVFALPIFGSYQPLFESEHRIAPIVLETPLNAEFSYRISLPRGYKLEDDSFQKRITNQSGTLKFEAFQNKNVVTFHLIIQQNQRIFSASRYSEVKEIYNAWFEISSKRWRILK